MGGNNYNYPHDLPRVMQDACYRAGTVPRSPEPQFGTLKGHYQCEILSVKKKNVTGNFKSYGFRQGPCQLLWLCNHTFLILKVVFLSPVVM